MNFKVHRAAETAIFISLGTILSFIKILHLPYGGTVTLFSMIPVSIIAYKYGFRWGLFSGSIFGLLQAIIGSSEGVFKGTSFVIVIFVIFLDYILAYTVIGFTGIFKKKFKNNLVSFGLGISLSCLLRFFIHILSGYLFFSSYAEWFFSQEGFSLGKTLLENFSGNILGIIYSVVYNLSYMLPETIITLIAGILIINVPAIKKRLIIN